MIAAFLWERSAYVKRNWFSLFCLAWSRMFVSLRCAVAVRIRISQPSRAQSVCWLRLARSASMTHSSPCAAWWKTCKKGALAARHRHVARLTPSEHCLGIHDQHGRAGRARHHKRPGVIFENVGRPWVKRFLAGVVAKKNGSVLFKSNKKQKCMA